MRAPRLFLGLLCGAVACGDDGTGPDGIGPAAFHAEVTGAVARSVEGDASFGTSTLGSNLFVLSLVDPEGTLSIGVTLEEGGRPAVGTYTLGRVPSGAYGQVLVDPAGVLITYLSQSGTLTITRSTPQSLRGTVSFIAVQELGGGGAAIEVTAEFDAFCLASGIATCD